MHHLALIGIAHICDGTPLYYDAMNECGLCGAALYFPENASYSAPADGSYNIASFEVLPFVLSQCSDVAAAREVLKTIRITGDVFAKELPPYPLHWIFSDHTASIVLEACMSGVQVYENPFGVLTNNPPFSYHRSRMSDFVSLTPGQPENRLAPNIDLHLYSRGIGSMGLPGDHSSSSRFIRGFFNKRYALDVSTSADVNAFFTVMGTVSIPRGCVKDNENTPFYTIYTSCADREEKIYYYTTHKNRQICGVRLSEESLTGNKLITVSMQDRDSICFSDPI